MNHGATGLYNCPCAWMDVWAALRCFCLLVKPHCFVADPSLRLLDFQWTLPHEPYDFMMGRGRLPQLDFTENSSCPFGIQSSRLWTLGLWTLTCGLLRMGRWIHNASPSGSSPLKKLPSPRWTSRRLHWTLENKCSGLTSSKPLSSAFWRTTTTTMAM